MNFQGPTCHIHICRALQNLTRLGSGLLWTRLYFICSVSYVPYNKIRIKSVTHVLQANVINPSRMDSDEPLNAEDAAALLRIDEIRNRQVSSKCT